MKISYSRFSAFMQNPERYRLYYGLNLKPENDDVPSFKNYGRRRGSCVHAIHEADGKGVRHSAITEKKYPDDMYKRCLSLVAKLPGMEILLSEAEFEAPIGPDKKHSITGRLDHVFTRDGEIRVGDIKSTKKRTRKEMREYYSTLETSSQSHFYLYVAALLGFPTDKFTYHVLIDEKDKPEYVPIDFVVGPAEVERTMRGVYAACEAIEGLTERVGVTNPWPHSNHWPCSGDKGFCGYSEICGRILPVGCVPPGFVSRITPVEDDIV